MLLLESMFWVKHLDWHMQWTLLPAELSTHPSHFRNDSCEEFRLHGGTQQEARMELGEKKKQIHSFRVHLGQF